MYKFIICIILISILEYTCGINTLVNKYIYIYIYIYIYYINIYIILIYIYYINIFNLLKYVHHILVVLYMGIVLLVIII